MSSNALRCSQLYVFFVADFHLAIISAHNRTSNEDFNTNWKIMELFQAPVKVYVSVPVLKTGDRLSRLKLPENLIIIG